MRLGESRGIECHGRTRKSTVVTGETNFKLKRRRHVTRQSIALLIITERAYVPSPNSQYNSFSPTGSCTVACS